MGFLAWPAVSRVELGVTTQSFWNWLKNTPKFAFVKIIWDDLFKLAVVWVALYLFHLLPEFMPVLGIAGTIIVIIHQAGSVAVAGLLVIFLILDVVESLRKREVT